MITALLTAHNQLLVLTDVVPSELAPGQVLVNMLVSGICGKQLGEIRGDYDANAPLPRIIGHEGCAIVEEVGPGVTKVEKGDKVICHWRKSEGMDAVFPRYYFDQGEFTTGKIATFAEQTILSENRLTKVPHETPNELCALLGCALSTALGVMENEAKLKMGESVLIVGCGGVGLNLIRVAKMMGACWVAARDFPSKEWAAEDAGASVFEPISEARGKGYDVIVDTTGSSVVFEDTLRCLGPGGRYILVGQPKSGAVLQIANARHLFDGEGKTIKATQGGQFNPDRDIPRYIQMWKSGVLRLDGIITHRFPFARINDAIELAKSGNAGRVMLEMI